MKLPTIARALGIALGALVASACGKHVDLDSDAAAAQVAHGVVRGHIRLTGAPPANETIRMNADPMCARAAAGAHVIDDAVIAQPDGSLANVFAELLGTLPDTPVPAEPVFIDQRGCVYGPRVVGLRAGQALQVRNSDEGLHNVHGVSTNRDDFNVSQPASGNHPYFAVTAPDGSFALRNVPTGTYEVRAWHERLGTTTSQVRVDSDRESNIEMRF